MQIFTGISSNLIVFPINFIIITLFRKARPRKLRPSRVDEAIRTAHDGPRTEASVNDVKPEVGKGVILCDAGGGGGGSGGGGDFILACENFGGRFDESYSA